jgi:predicted lipoprotein with Yx(FWY)xxD motif
VVAAAVGLAACGGSDDNATGSASASSGGSGGRSSLVSVQTVDGTQVLADARGRTLYTTNAEEGGRIRCIDACTSFWGPVEGSVEQAEAASAELNLQLGVIRRPDDGGQLTLDGLPLYTFTEEEAGRLEGDGFVDDFRGTHFVWEAATTGARAGRPAVDSGSPY